MRNCLTDEGGPPRRPACRAGIPNHLRRLLPKAMVVSAEGKGLALTGSGIRQEEDRREPPLKCRKQTRRCQTAALLLLRDKLRRNLFTGGAASGMRGGLSLPRRRLGGTWELFK